eukprot:2264420-Pyramimonas_sp.AAC.1
MVTTIDTPGKNNKVRFTCSFHGEVLPYKDQVANETLLKVVKEMGSEQHSFSPTEKPTEMYKLQGTLVPVETLFAEALRSIGEQL